MTPDLLAAYAEPHRRYHTLAHVEACLAELERVEGLAAAERETLALAIWWHDAVYDPTRSDNEEKSAAWAEAALAAEGRPAARVAEVARLVRLTERHEVEAGDRLAGLMVSIDLSVLGAAAEAYDAYVRAVRAEYGFVAEDAWRKGRAAVLRGLLERPAIYPDPAFRARLENRARANLNRELEALQSLPSPLGGEDGARQRDG